MTYTKENRAEAIYSKIFLALSEHRPNKVKTKNVARVVTDEILKAIDRGEPMAFWKEVQKEIENRK